ncbi:unnamed protein product [Musa acuminata subsp. malaccensis]|uniref:(wild Malaysian banana) hypothetical protein n=1 Tax=Musa acuminata subsp. malaccensis TaxID=214687 RepID=A0A8D7B2H9_MUSAM|nr:unnamed protein product [Musa acuminata subsp. malaccensis]
MGGKCPSRKVKKRRFSHKSARRSKFLLKDILFAVYNEILKQAQEAAAAAKPLPLDEDLPGMGQFYCLHCDRYFASEDVRDEHFRSKRHKKRVKQMSGPAPHTQLDADLAAGMGMPDNGPKLMSF